MKKIYAATFMFRVQYTKGHWFYKKTIEEEISFSRESLVLAEDENEDIDKFEKRDPCWLHGGIPWIAWNNWSDFRPAHFTTLSKSMTIEEVTADNIELLKVHMQANEFLAYCRQEMLEPMEVIK